MGIGVAVGAGVAVGTAVGVGSGVGVGVADVASSSSRCWTTASMVAGRLGVGLGTGEGVGTGVGVATAPQDRALTANMSARLIVTSLNMGESYQVSTAASLEARNRHSQ